MGNFVEYLRSDLVGCFETHFLLQQTPDLGDMCLYPFQMTFLASFGEDIGASLGPIELAPCFSAMRASRAATR